MLSEKILQLVISFHFTVTPGFRWCLIFKWRVLKLQDFNWATSVLHEGSKDKWFVPLVQRRLVYLPPTFIHQPSSQTPHVSVSPSSRWIHATHAGPECRRAKPSPGGILLPLSLKCLHMKGVLQPNLSVCLSLTVKITPCKLQCNYLHQD